MARTQEQRAIAVESPLGPNVLLFCRMTAVEALGRLFHFELDLLSENNSIKFQDLLGQKMTVRLELAPGQMRYFNGHVSGFSQTGSVGDLYAYHATLRPWLWFLTRTADCRIFQEKTIPKIIKEVFGGHGFTDYDEALSGSYQPWEYCVQYRETDFNFVSRLMEQQGIYYYFKHEKNKHTLVLSDSVSSHQPFPGYDQVPYYPLTEGLQRERDHIHSWSISQEVQPGTYALNDFDFKRPKANLRVKSKIQRPHVRAAMEIYDYPGEYVQTDEGEAYARARIEELQTDYERLQGDGNARGLAVGSLFQLTGYPRTDQDREYLITSATHELVSDEYESGGAGVSMGDIYSCSFTAIPSKQPFRPARITPKPIVQGPQTAIVVGPSGSEIYTDSDGYGRIKVQFHWDRYGKSDENSSCWIRVAQMWAGNKWGGVTIPRIGQEVMVEFLEGDPDHPIITGRFYNHDNMPPYALPANNTQSGIKSRSSMGGTPDDFNEFRFEDKKGQEEIYIHAQRNMNTMVENDQTNTVEHDKTNTVNHDFTETIKNNATIKIAEGVYSHDVMTGTAAYHVQSALTETYDATQTTKVMNNLTITSTFGTIMVSADGANILIHAATNIKLNTGASTIEMDSAGNIKIEGVNVSINGSSSVTTKGGVVHSEAVAQHQTKGAIVISEGSAVNTVKGGMVMLNP